MKQLVALLMLLMPFAANADFTISCYYGVQVDEEGDAERLLYSSPSSCAQEPLIDVSNSGVPMCPDTYIQWEGLKGGVIAADGDKLFFVAQRICLLPQWLSNNDTPM